MKRITFVLLVAAACLLPTSPAAASPTAKPKTVATKCIIDNDFKYDGNVVAATGGCSAAGKPVTNVKWFHRLHLADMTGSSCDLGLMPTSGIGSSFAVKPTSVYAVTATFTLIAPAAKGRRAGKTSSSQTLYYPVSKVVCGMPLDPVRNFDGLPSLCSWDDPPSLINGVLRVVGRIWCRGNGACSWQASPEASQYQQLGYTVHAGRVDCPSSNRFAVPVTYLTFTYPDGETCTTGFGAATSFPISKDWGGRLDVRTFLYTSETVQGGTHPLGSYSQDASYQLNGTLDVCQAGIISP